MLGKEKMTTVSCRDEGHGFLGFRNLGGEKAEILGWNALKDTRDKAEVIWPAWRGIERQRSFRLGQAFERGPKILEIRVTLSESACRGGDDFFRRAAQFVRCLAQSAELPASDALRAAATEKFNAPVLPDLLAAADQKHADLAGALNMSAATRLQVRRFDFDEAQDPLAVDFFSNAQLGQLFRGAVANIDRTVFENDRVCGALGAFQNFFRWFGAPHVNGRELGPEMEGNRGQPEAFLKHGRQQVLAAVLLHVIEAASPVDAALYFAARSEG